MRCGVGLLLVLGLDDSRDLPHQFGSRLEIGCLLRGVAIASHTLLKVLVLVLVLVIGHLSSIRCIAFW